MNLQDFKIQILPMKHQLYRVALRITGDPTEAEDVVQEVFIKVWDKRAQIPNIQNVQAFCMSMTKNLAIDKTRSKHRRAESLGEGLDFKTPVANPHQRAEMTDTMYRIEALMKTLPDKQKMVMRLRDIEGMAYEEIALAVDIPINQVKVNLFRARQKIREALINTDQYGLQ
jgi:RNA polymerase sigma factor (sigma-70 family)